MTDLLWAGIGARKTPPHILDQMTILARRMDEAGWHLRSGGADGADSSFAAGARPQQRTIFLPWTGYNGLSGPDCQVPTNNQLQQCLAIAERLHPAWHKCGQGVRKLHARNVSILLGPDLHRPVRAVVCWTERGQTVGGTGMGLRIAAEHDIPIFNLGFVKMDQAWAALRLLRNSISSAATDAPSEPTSLAPETMARVVHLRDAPPDAIRIDRGTPWGNPFRIGPDGDRREVIAKFRDHFWNRIHAGEVNLDQLAGLHGKNLACHCAPLPCHGDVLAEAAAWAVTNKRRTTAESRAAATPSAGAASLETLTRTYLASDACVFRFTKADWGVFSNFAPLPNPISAAGNSWPTSEHLYQAAKFRLSSAVQQAIAAAPSAREAAKIGRNRDNTPDADWMSRRADAMRWVIRMKREANRELIDSALDRTGQREIVEYSGHDAFWGAKPDGARLVGRNVLGRLWMELREQIRDGDPRALASAWPDPLTAAPFASPASPDHTDAHLPASVRLVTSHRRLLEASQDGWLRPRPETTFQLGRERPVAEDVSTPENAITVRITFDPRKFPFPALRAQLAQTAAGAADETTPLSWRGPIPLFSVTKLEVASNEHRTRLLALAGQFSNVSLPPTEIVVAGRDIASSAMPHASSDKRPALRLPDKLNAIQGALAMAASTAPREEPWTRVLQHALDREPSSFRSGAERINAPWLQLPWLDRETIKPSQSERGDQGRLWSAAMSTLQWPNAESQSQAVLAEKIARAASAESPNPAADLWLMQTLDIISAREPVIYAGSADEHAGLAIQLALLRPDPVRFSSWPTSMPDLPPSVTWAGAILCGWRHGYLELDRSFRGDAALQETIATSALAAAVPSAYPALRTGQAPDTDSDERTRINNGYLALLQASNQTPALIPYHDDFVRFRDDVTTALAAARQPPEYLERLEALDQRLATEAARSQRASDACMRLEDLLAQLPHLQQTTAASDPIIDGFSRDCADCLAEWHELARDPDMTPHVSQVASDDLPLRLASLAPYAELCQPTIQNHGHPVIRDYDSLLETADNKPELLACQAGFETLRHQVLQALSSPTSDPEEHASLQRISSTLDDSYRRLHSVQDLQRQFSRCAADALDLEDWAAAHPDAPLTDCPDFDAWRKNADALIGRYHHMNHDRAFSSHLRERAEARDYFSRRLAHLSEPRLQRPTPVANKQTVEQSPYRAAEHDAGYSVGL